MIATEHCGMQELPGVMERAILSGNSMPGTMHCNTTTRMNIRQKGMWDSPKRADIPILIHMT